MGHLGAQAGHQRSHPKLRSCELIVERAKAFHTKAPRSKARKVNKEFFGAGLFALASLREIFNSFTPSEALLEGVTPQSW